MRVSVRIGITIYSLHQYCRDGRMTVKEFIGFCGSLGVDAVDLGYYWQDVERELPLARDWLAEAGVALGSYIVGNNFAQPTAERLAEEVAKVKRAVDQGALLGAATLRIFVGDKKDSTYAAERDRLLPPLREVSDYAGQHGVVLALENHGTLAGRVDEVLDIVGAVDSPFLRLNVDVGNWMTVREDPIQSTRRAAPHAALCHIKDFKREGDRLTPTAVGEGEVDLAGCIRALREGGYDGLLSIEYEAAGEAKDGTRRSVEATKAALAAAGA
ncbi:MAG: hypothetical protein NVSMB65_05560 [Chloroflexota bacterium]